jgi:hypothetical protein
VYVGPERNIKMRMKMENEKCKTHVEKKKKRKEKKGKMSSIQVVIIKAIPGAPFDPLGKI